MHDVVIVGGGLGGLLAGVELARRGADVVVVEAADRPGGVATTVRDDGYLFEPAAGSLLLPHPHLGPILAAAGVELARASATARTRLVHTRRGLVAAPSSPATALRSPLVSPGGKARAALEPLVRARRADDDESLASTLRRRFGSEIGELASSLMAHGLVAGDPRALSTAALFPSIVELEQDAGSIVRGGIRRLRRRPKGTPRPEPHVHADGMAGVAASLASHLGDRFRPRWPATAVTAEAGTWTVHGPEALRARAVVLAVPPTVAAALLGDRAPVGLGRLRRAPVAVVGIGAPADQLPLPGAFGFLTAPDSPLRVLGVVFESRLAASRAPAGHHLVKAIYGGDADPSVLARDDGELVDLAVAELTCALRVRVEPAWQRVARVQPGIPQYVLGHGSHRTEIDAALADLPGLQVAGWSYRGVGVSALATDAVRVADALAA